MAPCVAYGNNFGCMIIAHMGKIEILWYKIYVGRVDHARGVEVKSEEWKVKFCIAKFM